jgi:hypothetical protein
MPPPPVVASVTPGTALWGAELTIDGTNFGAVQGESKVEFPSPVGANGFVGDTWSDTEITGRVAFPATGAVSVVTAGGDSSATFTTMQPWVPSTDLDVAALAQEIVLSTGDVVALYNEYELTNEPTLAVFTGSASGAYPLADLVDPQDPTATAVAVVVEADDHTPEVLGTKPDGTVGAFTLSGGSVTDTATGLTGNVIVAGRDATGLFAWIETETGIELAREGSAAWTAGSPITTPVTPVAGGAVASDNTLWIVGTDASDDATIATIAETGSAFSAPEHVGSAVFMDGIATASIEIASDHVHAFVTATSAGSDAPIALERTAAATWSAPAEPAGVVAYAFFGSTLGAVTNDASSMATALVPDVSMSTSQPIDVWPAQSAGFAVDTSGVAHPIVIDGNVAYSLTSSM